MMEFLVQADHSDGFLLSIEPYQEALEELIEESD